MCQPVVTGVFPVLDSIMTLASLQDSLTLNTLILTPNNIPLGVKIRVFKVKESIYVGFKLIHIKNVLFLDMQVSHLGFL